MIGKTNVGGGSQFSATVQIETDPNAVITAVNPAGDTYSGTADSSGDLTMVFSHPGTYTVTETGGGSLSLVVADDGATYSLKIIAFDGSLIKNGVEKVNFSGRAVAGGTTPSATSATISGESAILVSLNGGNIAQYITTTEFDISEYTSLSYRGKGNGGFHKICAVDSQNNTTYLAEMNASTISSGSALLTSLDRSKKYRFGIHLTSGGSVYVVDLKLQ